MLRVYLSRHGETEWNREQRLQGGTDISLNERGREQAAALARRLEGEPLARIYTSALKRSQETAAAFPAAIARIALPELNERRMGAYEGRSLATFSARDMDEYRRRKFTPEDDLDGGETLVEHWERTRRAWELIAHEERGERTIAVIGHGATNALLLAIAAGASLEVALRYRIHNDDLFLIEAAGSGGARVWQLVLADGFSALVG